MSWFWFFASIFIWVWGFSQRSRANTIQSGIEPLKRQLDEELLNKSIVDEQLDLASKLELKANESFRQIEFSRREVALESAAVERRKIDVERMVRAAEDIRRKAQDESSVFRSAIEEITNLWINDSWKSITDRLTADNYATQKSRLEKVFETCRKLGISFDGRSENAFFVRLKTAWETECELEKAKAEQARVRERMREEAKAEKARATELKRIEQETKDLEKKRRENEDRLVILRELEALKQLTKEQRTELESASQENRELNEQLEDRERRKSMAEMTRAGNVYVISNIGSFGEGIFKVGMTRRLIPEDRVKELGDASVPFPFDIHMMIPTEDAPALETKLHEALWGSRINLINDGKEFFRTNLSTIRGLVDRQGGKIVYEFYDHAKASQWRESEKRRAIGEVGQYSVLNEVAEIEEDAA